MEWISTTIKKIYLDQIEAGDKKFEFKGDTEHWRKRLNRYVNKELKNVGISFLCGRICKKYRVKGVNLLSNKNGMDIDGAIYYSYYAIHLGEKIR